VVSVARPCPVGRRESKEREDSLIPDSAWDGLFAAHYATVYGLLYRMVGDQADDLAQETFYRAWRAGPAVWEGDAAGGLRAWLCRVALNLGSNALRAERRRNQYEAAYGSPGDSRDLSPEPDPEAAAVQTDEAERVRAALAELRPRDAALLVLRAQGASYREVAEVLGVAEGSIGTLLRRAEGALVRAYPGQAPGAEGRSNR